MFAIDTLLAEQHRLGICGGVTMVSG